MFSHEKFEAYRISIAFVQTALQLVEQLPLGHSELREQLKRAAFSISLNIAEGTGKNREADRKRFYAIARGSAMECAAICDIIGIIQQDTKQEIADAKRMLRGIVGILTVICVGGRKKRRKEGEV